MPDFDPPSSAAPSGGGGKFKVQPRQAMLIVGAALVLLLAYRYYKNHYGASPAAAPDPTAGNGVDPTTGQATSNAPNPVPVINIFEGPNPSTPAPKPKPVIPKPKPKPKPPVRKPPVKPPVRKPIAKKPVRGGKGAGIQAPSRYSISSELVDNHSGLVAPSHAPTPPTGLSVLNNGGGESA
jgi:outer membrane biosynthesis protein TonB